MPSANGIYSLAVLGMVHGQQHIHTLHFRSTAAGNAVGMSETAFMADLVSTWKTACQAAYRAMFVDTNQPIRNFQVRKVCGSVPLPAGLDLPQTGGQENGTGTASGPPFSTEALAPWLASVVTERTAFSGRRYRGRFFMGGMHEAEVNGAVLAGSRITLNGNYCTALTTTFVTPLETAVNQKLFVYSKTQAAEAGTQCQNAGGDVTTLVVRDYLATMRSRKAGSGL